MKKNILFWLLSFAVTFTLLNCDKDENSTNTPSVPVCDQECQDGYVAYGYIDMFWFVWNQNIAGQPAGNKDFTVTGPQGGSVHVTGSTQVSTSTGINTLHLVIVMTNCKGIEDKYNLTFNGTITADGTFSTTHKAITYACPVLGYIGTIGKDDWVTSVSGTCNAIINEGFSTVSGTMCERVFNY